MGQLSVRRRMWRCACGLTAALAMAAPTLGSAEPLPVRDQNPLIRGLYLPLPAPALPAVDGWSVAAALEWSNTVNIERSVREQLLVDEETAELDLTLARAMGPWRLRATLPVITRGGGVLDGFIDVWHRFFHLPQGERPSRPRNAYAIDYARSGGPSVDAPDGTALGDLALEGGRVLAATPRGDWVAWFGAKAPTGSRTHLTGDGALDLGAWLAGEVDLGGGFVFAVQAGASHAGGATPLPVARLLRFGTVSFGWRATPRLEAIVQFDGHSALVRDSDLRFLGRAVLLTLGGRYRLASGSIFEAGVIEDIEVDHSPDVTFHFGWRWPPAR
jgi:hypothetical protein